MGNKNESTATAPAKEKAKPGTSIAARAKATLVTIHNDLLAGLTGLNEYFEKPLKLSDVLTPENAKAFTALVEEIGTSASRGLPLETRLANTEAEIVAHWKAIDTNKATGLPSAEWQAKSNVLMNRKASIERAIKNAADKAKAANSTSTDKGVSATK